MRKVVLIMTASIDGYVAAPSGNAAGGHSEPAELKRWKLERIRRAGTHIMGRVTYEGMVSVWPQSSDDYAQPMNDIPKVVFSRSLTSATWRESTIARGDTAEEIARLKREPGGDIIAWGGASFAQSLSRHGLIDEYAIVTRPIAYGGGKALFGDLPDALELELLAATTYSGGVALNLYASKR
jgi:dihydrofolate reductase